MRFHYVALVGVALSILVIAAPYANSQDACGVSTVYVTVPPNTFETIQLPDSTEFTTLLVTHTAYKSTKYTTVDITIHLQSSEYTKPNTHITDEESTSTTVYEATTSIQTGDTLTNAFITSSVTPVTIDAVDPLSVNHVNTLDMASTSSDVVIVYKTISVIPLPTAPPVHTHKSEATISTSQTSTLPSVEGTSTITDQVSSIESTIESTTTLDISNSMLSSSLGFSTSEQLSSSSSLARSTSTVLEQPAASTSSSFYWTKGDSSGWNSTTSIPTQTTTSAGNTLTANLSLNTKFSTGGSTSLDVTTESVDFSLSSVVSFPVSPMSAHFQFIAESSSISSISTTVSYNITYPTLHQSSQGSSGNSTPSTTENFEATIASTISASTSAILPADSKTSSVTLVGPSSTDSGVTASMTSTSTTSSTVIVSSSISNTSGTIVILSTTSSESSSFMTDYSTTLTTLSVVQSLVTSASSTSSLSNATATAPPTPIPTTCGPQGDFILNFDDIPPLASNASTVEPEPVFNPYHKFWFSGGFVVVPPPTDPYLPSSGTLLVEFLRNFFLNDTTTLGPKTGEIGAGRNEGFECFGFNVLGASFGCDSTGPPCDWQFTGVQYNPATDASTEITTQRVSTPACPSLVNCPLVPITLDDTFEDLTSVRINVTVAGVPKIWWMDDLHLEWHDNTCDAGICRQNHRR